MLWDSHAEKFLHILNFVHCIFSLRVTTACSIIWVGLYRIKAVGKSQDTWAFQMTYRSVKN